MDSPTDDPPGSPAPGDRPADVRARAAAVAEVLADAGMAVRLVEDRLETGADGELHGWTDDPYDHRNQTGADAVRPPTGVRITIVVERRVGQDPFDGVRVEWLIHPRLREAASDALAHLMATGGGFPDTLPDPIARNGRLHEIMRDAIGSILSLEGFTFREDDDLVPFALWVLDGPAPGTEPETR